MSAHKRRFLFFMAALNAVAALLRAGAGDYRGVALFAFMFFAFLCLPAFEHWLAQLRARRNRRP